MGRGTVCLSFDFDAFAGESRSTPGQQSRGEFSAVAVPRLLNLLAARGIAATFYIPGQTAETFPAHCRDIVSAGHEVALHGYDHERGQNLAPEREREVTRRAFDAVGNLLGRAPVGSRAPSWDLTPVTLDILMELGIRYDSSLMAQDYRPYYARTGDVHPGDGPSRPGPETPLVELPISWSLDDWPHFEYGSSATRTLPGLRNARSVFENWLDDVAYMERDFEDGVVTMTCHPEVIGRGHRLLGFERLIDAIAAAGHRFARMDQVAEEFRAGRQFGRYAPAVGPYREHPFVGP